MPDDTEQDQVIVSEKPEPGQSDEYAMLGDAIEQMVTETKELMQQRIDQLSETIQNLKNLAFDGQFKLPISIRHVLSNNKQGGIDIATSVDWIKDRVKASVEHSVSPIDPQLNLFDEENDE
jgi:hypothetical protein